MQFPVRDLTNQYISLSYHDVVQRYAPGGTASYFLDGTGNVIAYIPTASIGKALATLDDIITSDSASWASSSISASYAATSTIAAVALIAEQALTASLAESASWAPSQISIRTLTSNGNVSLTDYTLVITGSSAITVTLPAASASHEKIFIIKNRNTNPTYVLTADGALIDGNGPLTSSFKNTSIQLQCSGSEWFIL